MGGGDDTQTTTQQTATNYPQWTQDALKGLVGAGTAMNSPFLQVPRYQTAGMNPDQMKAMDLARQTAQSVYQGGQTAIKGDTTAQPAQLGGPAMASAASATAQQVDPNAIAGNMNPFIDAVIDPALKQAARSRDENQASIGQRAAASGSFGGSREAIERGQADRAYQEGTASMVAQLMAQGWDQASALAQANAQMRQQTALSNAGMQQQTNMANQSASNTYGLTQGGYDQQAAMYNAGIPMERARMEDALRTSDMARQQSAMQGLLGMGNQQQLFAQSVLDTPWTALSRYASLVPQVYNSSGTATSTQPDNSPGFLQSLLGAGLTVGTAGTTGGGSLLGNWLS